MPKLSINYQKTVMYKLVCKDLNVIEFYVGSTTDFINRKRQHKECTTNENSKEYNQTKYQFIRDHGGWENWEMIEIEKYPCWDGNESKARERYWIETLHANMNTQTPGRTDKEYVQSNKERIKGNHQRYRDKNILFTCECGSTCRAEAKAKHFRTNKHQEFIALKNV